MKSIVSQNVLRQATLKLQVHNGQPLCARSTGDHNV